MPTSTYLYAAFLIAIASVWSSLVNRSVALPYLDEFFHIPQAQQYCLGNYHVWDPKITTPPGLYLIATALRPIFGCNTSTLRLENVACILALFFCIARLAKGTNTAHTALNTTLFPPLFFFSALYYTDVPSTLSVVIFHICWSQDVFRALPAPVPPVCLYLVGLVSLLFRQTNIFWIAVYPAALTLCRHCDAGHDVVKQSMYQGKSGFGDSWTSIIKTSWKLKVVYDRDVADAHLEDYIKNVLTIAVSLVRSLTELRETLALLYALSPFIGLVVRFAWFVYQNGGVVLGDKSNHIATLHLPQMLYIWPYITFFSWPVLLPRLIDTATVLYSKMTSKSPSLQVQRILPTLGYLIVFSNLALFIVRYNTIVHPFTLADNRHYTFYVFRLLLRTETVRYAVIPVYALSAWLCVQSLGRLPSQQPATRTGTTTSSVMIWLATSALQLITAPLVEPRYFILPWLFWRLNVTLPTPGNPRLISARHILMLETTWLVAVQAITGYLFLYRPFLWPSEPNSLQRFMW